MGIAKRSGKVALWMLALSFALVVALYLVLLAINFTDQPPSESALRIQKIVASRAPVAAEENAYPYLLGFPVAPEEDPGEWGERRVAWLNEIAEQSLTMSNASSTFEFPGEDYDFCSEQSSTVGEVMEHCGNVIDSDCLKLLEQHAAELAQWATENRWLLARYEKLLEHPVWREQILHDIRQPFPNYSPIINAQRLRYIKAWLEADRSDPVAIKAMLDRDIRFWRQVLLSSDTLITKMIAAAAIGRHFQWGNAVLRRLPADKSGDAIPDSWQQPISREERSLLRTLAGEWQFNSHMIEQIVDVSHYSSYTEEEISLIDRAYSALISPLYQPQDNRNKYADRALELAAIYDVPYEEYPQAIERAKSVSAAAQEESYPPSLYNPVGSILFGIGAFDMSTYAVRAADLEGIRRLSLAVAEMRSRSTPAAQVASALESSEFRNPYTNEPFSWDETTQSTLFLGLVDGERDKHFLVY